MPARSGLKRLAFMLKDRASANTLLLIDGMPGVGKTFLANIISRGVDGFSPEQIQIFHLDEYIYKDQFTGRIVVPEIDYFLSAFDRGKRLVVMEGLHSFSYKDYADILVMLSADRSSREKVFLEERSIPLSKSLLTRLNYRRLPYSETTLFIDMSWPYRIRRGEIENIFKSSSSMLDEEAIDIYFRELPDRGKRCVPGKCCFFDRPLGEIANFLRDNGIRGLPLVSDILDVRILEYGGMRYTYVFERCAALSVVFDILDGRLTLATHCSLYTSLPDDLICKRFPNLGRGEECECMGFMKGDHTDFYILSDRAIKVNSTKGKAGIWFSPAAVSFIKQNGIPKRIDFYHKLYGHTVYILYPHKDISVYQWLENKYCKNIRSSASIVNKNKTIYRYNQIERAIREIESEVGIEGFKMSKISRATIIRTYVDLNPDRIIHPDSIIPRPLIDMNPCKLKIEEWIASNPADARDLLRLLVKKITYIDQLEFEIQLESAFKEAVMCVDLTDAVLVTHSSMFEVKSTCWCRMLLDEKGLISPYKDRMNIFFEDKVSREMLQDISAGKYRDIVIIDDAAFTGDYLVNICKDLIDKVPEQSAKLTFHLIVPYMTNKAIDKINYYLSNVKFYVVDRIKTIKDMLSVDELELFYRHFNPSESLKSIFYFQHKIANYLSVCMPILGGMVKPKGRSTFPDLYYLFRNPSVFTDVKWIRFIPEVSPPYKDNHIEDVRKLLINGNYHNCLKWK